MLVIFTKLCDKRFLALNRQHVKELTLESGRSRRDDDDDNEDEGRARSRSTTVRRTSLVVVGWTTFAGVRFCLFALGDRAYSPNAFCAAGRKLASRLVQLGGTPACQIGYGDDGTPKVGVCADLDGWREKSLLTVFPRSPSPTTTVT